MNSSFVISSHGTHLHSKSVTVLGYFLPGFPVQTIADDWYTQHGKGMFQLDRCVAYIASNALKKISDTFNDILVRHGSTRVQWIALYYVAAKENISQSELAQKMNVQTPTIVRLVDRLEKEGYVRRIHDVDDRRRIQLRCTDTGRALNSAMLPIGDAFSEAITRGIDEDELNTFIDVLEKMVGNSQEIKKKI